MDDHRGKSVGRWRWLGWGLSLLAGGFIIRWLLGVDHHVWQLFRTFHWRPAIVSLVILQAWYLLRYLGWSLISRQFGVIDTHAANMKMWTLSELLRYIPGNVWSLAARFRGARQRGADRGGATMAVALEAIGLIFGAATVAAWFWRPGFWVVWTAGVLMAIGLLPVLLNFIGRWRKWTTTTVTWSQSAQLIFLYVVVWLVYGYAQALIIQALPGLTLPAIPRLIGINVLAWLLGYLSLVTPMGLGVREVVFVSLLRTTVLPSLASVLAVLTRVWLVISELVFLGLVMILAARSPKKP